MVSQLSDGIWMCLGAVIIFSTSTQKVRSGCSINCQPSRQLLGHVEAASRAQCQPQVARAFESAIYAHKYSGTARYPRVILPSADSLLPQPWPRRVRTPGRIHVKDGTIIFQVLWRNNVTGCCFVDDQCLGASSEQRKG